MEAYGYPAYGNTAEVTTRQTQRSCIFACEVFGASRPSHGRALARQRLLRVRRRVRGREGGQHGVERAVAAGARDDGCGIAAVEQAVQNA